MPVYTDISEAKGYIEKMNKGVSQSKWIIWAICLEDENNIIGTISIWNINHEKESAELGYGIYPKYRNNGYMKEALELVIDYGFNEMDLKLIEVYTSHDNKPSINLLEKMNFKFFNTIKDDYSNGALMDIYHISP